MVASSPWPTAGGDVRHSGLNAAETGRPPLRLAWERPLKSAARYLGVAISGGRIVTSVDEYGKKVACLDASDGSTLWTFATGDHSPGAPAIFDGSVYVPYSGRPANTKMSRLALATGAVEWTSLFSAQGQSYWPPIVVGGSIYFNGGTYGGLYRASTSDGTSSFFAALEQFDSWSPAFFAGHIYTFVNGSFRAHDASTGAVAWTVELGWTWSGWSMNTSPVFGERYGYAIASSKLRAVNPATQAVAWTANGFFTGTPAVANGVVYAFSAGNLLARDALTGALLWTFAGDGALAGAPIVANGFVYVSSDKNTYAVNVATQASEWSAPRGGALSLGDHRLVIWDGKLMTGYALEL